MQSAKSEAKLDQSATIEMNQFGDIPFISKLIYMHIFFVTLIVIQIFDIVVIVMVFVGEVAKLKDFNFAFWMELEIMSELLKCALLIVYCYHVARKKVDLDE